MGALSRGCNTCKRRKVRCDETRPRCNRCCKSGIKCSGFVPRLRFVNENHRLRRAVRTSEVFDDMPSNDDKHRQRLSSSGETPIIELARNHQIGPVLHLQAFRSSIFMSYLISKLFERGYQNLNHIVEWSSCGVRKEWMIKSGQAIETPRQKPWDALAAGVFGRAFNNQYALGVSLGLYGQAVRGLHDRLATPDSESADTLASITALYMHEMIMREAPNAWMVHADGLSSLVERRGPHLQKPPEVKGLFLEHRLCLIFKAIVSGQRTFLHRQIWKTVPWEDDPTSKTPIDYLLDIGADIVEYTAILNACQSSGNSNIAGLNVKVEASLRELNAWWIKWEALHPQPAWTTSSCHAKDEPLFTESLEYDMIWTAFTVCIYNAMRILLLRLWKLVGSADHEVVLDMPNPTALLGITSDIKGLACEIVRSFSYSYRQSRPIVFTCSFLFIQDVVYGCFERTSREAQWIASHGWADRTNLGQAEDRNLLRRQQPSGRIRVGSM